MANLTEEKKKATRLLSKFVQQIAEEKSEVGAADDGMPIMISKAEALARRVWMMALGYVEEQEVRSGDSVTKNSINHPPNPGMIALLYDRMEGRVPLAQEIETGKRTIADRVSEQGRNRINKLGGIKNSESRPPKPN
jgi:hypothetical protein